jgi:hypothetical protein
MIVNGENVYENKEMHCLLRISKYPVEKNTVIRLLKITEAM